MYTVCRPYVCLALYACFFASNSLSKLCPQKIVTSPSTLRLATAAEVSHHFPPTLLFRTAHKYPTSEFISGFSGSAGTAIISLSKAALSTDGRYFNQAAKQLDGNWELLKSGIEGVPTWQEWYGYIDLGSRHRKLSVPLGQPSKPRVDRLLESTLP